MFKALTIAGSDSSGGAGIQADLKTMLANGVYGMSAVAALTAQNTTGVRSIYPVSPEFLADQIDMVFEDIRPDAIKIGMVSGKALIETIADRLKVHQAQNIVLDPVMAATSGSLLIEEDAIETLQNELFGLASLITPNIPEAEILCGFSIENEKEMGEAAKAIYERWQTPVLVKGGHEINDANDLFFDGNHLHWFYGRRIANDNTHGTGCTLSSAIASNLAKGYGLQEAIQRAKGYLSGALEANLNLGQSHGPVDHGFELDGTYASRGKDER
ncbi:bifunctional hydroxymethylpyrimidine kinase/phosphomethylpyrimidine kinase [Erysipelotrichaceae bacterium RD49]|nr:bifunctional hydroxymethylpyrimidine kinase/phosphomethylpyrimidine kinase [Erysipelotrichaceae bacterium RD49]